jgi:uncharacterized membrane protein YkoI
VCKASTLTQCQQLIAVAILAVFAWVLPVQARADHGGHRHSTAHLQACLEQIHKIKHTRDYVKVEYLSVTHEGDPSFEIEVRDPKGIEWEFMCAADEGSIYEFEQEASAPSDPRFKENVEVSPQQARRIVTRLYPGRIEETEYELESNGASTYEIDVVGAADTEFKVEVDAASGDVIEVHVEEWEIGAESDERGAR